jgi:hypothetical protein
MSSLAAHSSDYLALALSGESTANELDAKSRITVSGQGATASTAIENWLTEPNLLSTYDTLLRFGNRTANLTLQTPDSMVSTFDRLANDAVSSAVPDFLLRRAAPTVGKPKGSTDEVIAEWDGYVTEVGEETIEAQLRGLRGDGVAGEIEEATIPKAEVRDADKPLIAAGALFRLCISYEKTPAGERRRYSTLVFRRLPAYRQQDLDDAHERTRARLNGLRLD